MNKQTKTKTQNEAKMLTNASPVKLFLYLYHQDETAPRSQTKQQRIFVP